MAVNGQFIGDETIRKILDADCFIADISILNLNVTYEIGFAIGSRKPICLIRQAALEDEPRDVADLGVFDTIGWKVHRSSSDLVEILLQINTLRPIGIPDIQLNEQAPIFLLDARDKIDSVIMVKSRIKKSGWPFRSFDPEETSRLNPYEAIKELYESAGVVVTFLPKHLRDSRLHNLRASFLAGLAGGFNKELLILQLGDDPVAIDYRDLVRICRRPELIVEAIADLTARVTSALQAREAPVLSIDRKLLSRLDLGASAAENELRALHNYYVETDAYRRARRGEARLVLGRKGSGKTALFAQVRDFHRQNKRNIVIDIKPEGYKLLKFKEDVSQLMQTGTFEHTITALWEYVLLLEVAYKLLEKDRATHYRDHSLFDKYSQLSAIYRSEEYSTEGDFSERLSVLLDMIGQDAKSRYISQRERPLRLSTADITDLIYKHNIRSLVETIQEYLGHKDDVWILIDNLDKGWPTTGLNLEDLTIIRTLLEATRKIERQFEGKGVSCRTIVFVRNDVLRTARGPNA